MRCEQLLIPENMEGIKFTWRFDFLKLHKLHDGRKRLQVLGFFKRWLSVYELVRRGRGGHFREHCQWAICPSR